MPYRLDSFSVRMAGASTANLPGPMHKLPNARWNRAEPEVTKPGSGVSADPKPGLISRGSRGQPAAGCLGRQSLQEPVPSPPVSKRNPTPRTMTRRRGRAGSSSSLSLGVSPGPRVCREPSASSSVLTGLTGPRRVGATRIGRADRDSLERTFRLRAPHHAALRQDESRQRGRAVVRDRARH